MLYDKDYNHIKNKFMKKNRVQLFWKERKKCKFLLMMRLSLFFVFLFHFSLSAVTYSQSKKVNLNLKNVSAMEFFKEIQEQTGYSFVFNQEQAKTLGLLSIQVEETTVNEVLDRVLGKLHYSYRFEGDIIVITPQLPQQKERRIVGRVVDEKKFPLPGVTVRLKGANMGTATDKDGCYSISFPEMKDPVLVFSFVGMESQEISCVGKDTIDLVMKESSAQLEEVIVNTGYQQVDSRKMTSAITSIKAEDIIVPGINSIDQMLEGRVPGMIFMQNSGQVGAVPRLRIRGTSTILGNQEPLWVVDGIVQQDPVNVDPSQINDLDFVNLLGNAISGLNPEDIEQIDVLKDASATAIYGARAANGVIVITTKKGKAGPPTLSYSVATTFTRRPHYSDRSIDMMNSKERIDFSRELFDKGIVYPKISSWVGYEGVMRDFYNDEIDFTEMQRQVGELERMNTDWFSILTRDAFSHSHTLSLSGGSSTLRYYASVGFKDMKGSIKAEENKLYTANLRVTANYNRFSVQFGLNASVSDKDYTPGDVGVMSYAYNTSRAVPAYNEDGSLWYYQRPKGSSSDCEFNILNEIENSFQDIKTNGFMLNTSVDYQVIDPLKVGITISYNSSNTIQKVFHGQDSYYAKILQSVNPADNYLPEGGELQEGHMNRDMYMVRGQVNYNQFMDKEENHQITAAVGAEVSSNHYTSLEQTYRGYMPDRGQQMADVDLSVYKGYARWLGTAEAKGVREDQKTNLVSGYASFSYAYQDRYVLNANVRFDASNKFGTKSNDKLAPIWSLSGRWNVQEDLLKNVKWVDHLSLRGSWGYQGNMLDTESSQLIIQRGNINTAMGQYQSKIYKYPNPYLKWEKTVSTNITLEFGLLKNRIRGNVSYFYKKTKDAFLTQTISDVNGISAYTVNQGTVKNQGVELSFNFIPVNLQSKGNPDGFRWSFDPQLGQVLNQLINRKVVKDNALRDISDYNDYLAGRVEIVGRPLNTFYSYKFKGLDPKDGRPMFYDVDQENESVYDDMKRTDVYMKVMSHSGTRVPKIQGGFVNTFSYQRFTLSMNLTYSLGAKVRLLPLYPAVYSGYESIAPQPEANARKEFARRWKRPGDEAYTNVPGILSGDEFVNTLYDKWYDGKSYQFADNIWAMYDHSDLRVVKSDYLRMQSLSLRYNFREKLCRKLFMKSAYVGFSCTNLFTICSKKLKGQDPATQSGSSSAIDMTLRPTYSLNLNVSF